MTFSEWKRLSMVRQFVPQIVKIDLEQLSTWHQYKAAVYHADREKIFDRVDKLCRDPLERDELIAIAGICWTMDYASISQKIAQQSGFDGFLAGLSHCGDEAREVIGGALLQRD